MKDEIMQYLKNRPQTYKTMLAGRKENPTRHVLCQRHMSKLIDEGLVHCASIPGRNGSRGCERLFFIKDKKYFIVLSVDARGKEHYYFAKAYAVGSDILGEYIQLEGAYELIGEEWCRRGDKTIHLQNVRRIL